MCVRILAMFFDKNIDTDVVNDTNSENRFKFDI